MELFAFLSAVDDLDCSDFFRHLLQVSREKSFILALQKMSAWMHTMDGTFFVNVFLFVSFRMMGPSRENSVS